MKTIYLPFVFFLFGHLCLNASTFTAGSGEFLDSLYLSNCLIEVNAQADPATCEAIVSWPLPTVNGGTGQVTLTSNYDPGDALPYGKTIVTYYVSDDDGQTDSCSFEIIVSEALVINSTNASCYGDANGSVAFDLSCGQAPYQIEISGVVDSTTSATSFDFGNLPAGTYELIVTDVSGISSSTIFQIDQNPALQLEVLTISSITCNGDNTGILAVSVSGGCGPYLYEWDVGVTTPDCPFLGAGTYSVTVTDCMGCTVTATATITEPESLEADLSITCSLSDEGTGAIEIDITGGVAPYSYTWAGIPPFPNTGLAPGFYHMTITDANGCNLILDSMEVGLIDAAIDTDTLYGAPGDQAQVIITHGPNLDFSWTASSDLSCNDCPDPIITLNASGVYEVTISDQNSSCTTMSEVMTLVDYDFVWPGDTDTNGVVNNFDLLNIGLAYDSTGPTRPGATLNWTPQIAPDWSASTPNTSINLKHSDTDGNGIVNRSDTLAINQNWGLMHLFTGNDKANRFQTIPIASGRAMTTIYVEVDTFSEGQAVALPIILGDSDFPADQVYGLAFSIEYDSSLVEAGSVSIGFNNSWLGTYQSDLIGIQKDFHNPGRIDLAMTRIDGQNRSGEGEIARLFITIEDDILFRTDDENTRASGEAELIFHIRDLRIINFSEEELPVEAGTSTAIVQSNTTGTFEIGEAHIQLFPNPVSQELWIKSVVDEIEQIGVYDALGHLVLESQPYSKELSLSVAEIPQGIYWVRVRTRFGEVVSTLSVVR